MKPIKINGKYFDDIYHALDNYKYGTVIHTDFEANGGTEKVAIFSIDNVVIKLAKRESAKTMNIHGYGISDNSAKLRRIVDEIKSYSKIPL